MLGTNIVIFEQNKDNQMFLLFILQAFGCIDQDRDGVIKKQDLKETYAQLGILSIIKPLVFIFFSFFPSGCPFNIYTFKTLILILHKT